MSTQNFSPDIESFVKMTKEKYKHIEFNLEAVKLESNSIYVFFVKSNEDQLKLSWAKINSWIGGNFQPLLESEFERWNIYLFFLVPGKVATSLKYQIENNTLACRKLVIEGEKSFESIIKEHITNTDLKILSSDGREEITELAKDPDLENLLSNTKIRAKKNKQNAKEVFEQLYDFLRKK